MGFVTDKFLESSAFQLHPFRFDILETVFKNFALRKCLKTVSSSNLWGRFHYKEKLIIKILTLLYVKELIYGYFLRTLVTNLFLDSLT